MNNIWTALEGPRSLKSFVRSPPPLPPLLGLLTVGTTVKEKIPS